MEAARLPLAIISASVRVSGRKQQHHMNERCCARTKTSNHLCVQHHAKTRIKTTSSPCDAERWPDGTITSHQEFLWVTGSESQSAAAATVSQENMSQTGLVC